MPEVSEKEKRKKKRKSPKSHLNSYANDDIITYVYPDSDVLYSEDKEVVKEGDYPIEINSSNDLIIFRSQRHRKTSPRETQRILSNHLSLSLHRQDSQIY
jgi:hypothetical protein